MKTGGCAGGPLHQGGFCEPLITADRAAELLKLHPKTVKKLAQAGKLPGMKIGRVWRFRESSLDAWMSAGLQCCSHPSPKGEAIQ
jgi:excisionase family DNA binding protein